MSTITTKDGTDIYYKDWGTGPVVTFSHGWPLNADAWDGQMLFLVQNGYRCVALDRRGHGRSSQASAHNDMDGYADDLAAVIEALEKPSDVPNFVPPSPGVACCSAEVWKWEQRTLTFGMLLKTAR